MRRTKVRLFLFKGSIQNVKLDYTSMIMRALVLILFLITLNSCRAKDPWQKVRIEVSEVDSIMVWRRESTTDINSSKNYIKLSDLQVKKVIDGWNNARSVGLSKYLPTFEMTVYSNGHKRDFRINAGHIKEDHDFSYDLGDKKFFENILSEQ